MYNISTLQSELFNNMFEEFIKCFWPFKRAAARQREVETLIPAETFPLKRTERTSLQLSFGFELYLELCFTFLIKNPHICLLTITKRVNILL